MGASLFKASFPSHAINGFRAPRESKGLRRSDSGARTAVAWLYYYFTHPRLDYVLSKVLPLDTPGDSSKQTKEHPPARMYGDLLFNVWDLSVVYQSKRAMLEKHHRGIQ